MTIKVGINGFGRIGRTFLRNFLKLGLNDIKVVCINDAYMEGKFMAYIFKHDSVFGKYDGKVEFSDKENKLSIDDNEIQVQRENQPKNIKWSEAGVDIVIESTGFFNEMEQARGHMEGGAKRVIVTGPSREVPMYVRGVNFDKYKSEETIISSASETTYCTTLLCRLLLQKFKIEGVMIHVVHAATSQQRMVDGSPLHEDLRTGRSVHNNVIPTKTSATYAIEKIIPELHGKVLGHGTRVSQNNVSYVVLDLVFGQEVTQNDLIKYIKEMSDEMSKETEYEDLLAWNETPLVSGDFCGREESAIVDFGHLKASKKIAQVPAWFDNEWSYSKRLCDLLLHVVKQDQKSKVKARN